MRILVIEDDPLLRRNLKRGLTEATHTVDTSEDAKDGRWFLDHHRYDVIILDRNLPDRDGLDLLRELRHNGYQGSVLILTAHGETNQRIEGLNAGADDYLAKPFDFGELLARINALMRRVDQDRRTSVDIGQLHLNLTARRVYVDKVEIELTGREYALLEYLCRRRGDIVSRQELYDQVYAFDDDVASNVVDVYIGYLRKKLQREGAPALIRTHRGKGYELWDGNPNRA